MLAAGTLRLENNQALGTGALTTTGSVVDYGNGVTIANPIVVNSDTTQLSVTAGTATQAGAISELNGPRPLEKIGAGTLVFTAANTYSGATAITAGTLMVNGSIANSAVTVNSGGHARRHRHGGRDHDQRRRHLRARPAGHARRHHGPGQSRVPVGGALSRAGQSVDCIERQCDSGRRRDARGNRAGGVLIGKLRVAHLHHPRGRGRSRRHHVQRVDHDQPPRRFHRQSELHRNRRDLEPHRRARPAPGRARRRRERQPAQRRRHAQQFLQQWRHAAGRLRERCSVSPAAISETRSH